MPLHGADCVIASRLQWQTVAENSSAPAKLEEPYLARCPKEGSENAYGSRASDKRTGMRETKAGRWIVVSGRIGKRQSTTWNRERTGETARLGAHEALPHTPPGGRPPETPGPLSLRSDCRDREGSVKGSQAAPKTGAPLTDPSRPGTRSLDEGKGARGQAAWLCRLPLVGSEEWVQTREGKSLLDKNDLLMEDAESHQSNLDSTSTFARQILKKWPG